MILTRSDNVVMYVVLYVICLLGINGKPSLSFNIPAIGPFANFGREPMQPMKIYSGKRMDQDAMRMIYYYDLTVAVVELGPNKLLLNCELVEIYEPDQVFDVLGELRETGRPVAVSFEEMLTLMNQCKELADTMLHNVHEETRKNYTSNHIHGRGIKNPFTLLSGIIPGTKWCGTGDIAKDYFDLGAEVTVDLCCRAHDLCPVKIRAYSNRYNLTNNSLYTKSHCICDDNLFNCLKISQTNTAQFMGNVYFNLVQVPCIEEGKSGRRFRNSRNNF